MSREPGSITPTVKLNGLEMKRGEPAISIPLDQKPAPATEKILIFVACTIGDNKEESFPYMKSFVTQVSVGDFSASAVHLTESTSVWQTAEKQQHQNLQKGFESLLCKRMFPILITVKMGHEITIGTGPKKKIAKRNAFEAMLLQLGYKASSSA